MMPRNKRLLIPAIPSRDLPNTGDAALSTRQVEAETRRRLKCGQVGNYPRVEHNCSDYVQAAYEVLRDLGVPDWLASMQATQRTPAFGGTEHNFLQGRDNNQEFDTMPKDMRRFYLRKAVKAGVVPHGKVYVSQLAKEAGDPSAWVSSQHEAQAKAKAQGKSTVKE